MLGEDLDDTHLCIKCSATIVGLDNYVQHRKTNCGGKTTRSNIVPGYGGFEYPDTAEYVKSEVETSGGKTSKALNDPYDLPYELGADVFFSSLQLQSVQASSGGKSTTTGQQILTKKATTTLLSSGRDEPEGDWQEEPANNTDNLMKVVRDIGETKKFDPIFKPIAFTQESPEHEQSDNGEIDDADFDDDDDDEDYVPTPYSGGKWKPGSQPAPRSGGKWKGKSKAAPPPSSGGKWHFKITTGDTSKWKASTKSPRKLDLSSQIRAKLKSKTKYVPNEWKPDLSKFSGGKWKSSDRQKLPDGLEPQTVGKRKSDSAKPPKLLVPDLTGGKSSEGNDWPEILESQTGGKWKPGDGPCGGKWKLTGGKWKSSEGNDSPEILESQAGGKWKPGDEPPVGKWKLTGGKWKSSEGNDSPEILESQAGGKWKPGDEPPVGKWKLTGGKWKSSEGNDSPEILESQAGGKWKPGDEPPVGKWKLTGGKWKSSEGNDSPEILESQAGGKWKPGDEPPGGKWKPGDRQINLKVSSVPHNWDDQESRGNVAGGHPSDEYTQGKWVPGTKVERLEYNEEGQPPPQDFWCNICCRKLKTKTIYEKHLKSSMHLKKSETEQQLERAAVEQLELSQKVLRPPPLVLDRVGSPSDPGKRKRRKTFIKCGICKHRMPRYLVGKHLISHYHYVRMRLNPQGSFGMILDNIHQIVLQSPFQCSPCRFYANTEENFLNHWNSVEHRDRTEGPGKFWCSFCRFECEDNNQMRRHLLGTDHREVILAINRSVPIYISKMVSIECPKCHQGFRFNMELRQHAAKCDGTKVDPIGTASDEYQSRFRCELCPDEVLKSKMALQRHEKFKHNKKRYYCSICDVEFENPAEAIKHRKTKAHRMKSIEKFSQREATAKKKDLRCEKCGHVSSSEVDAMLHQMSCKKDEKKPETPTENSLRKCPYCKESLKTKSELKLHLNTIHPEAKHICPLCGEAFTLTQELGSHRRYKVCIASTSRQSTPSNKDTWKCTDCSFSSAFESELIFHRIIHTDGLKALESEDKLKCPLCEKSFSKHSLRHHLRQHTNEKTFVCEICKRSFSRRHNYKEHMQYLHPVEGAKKRKRGRSTDESFICDTCGKIFRTKYSLKLHINIHTERDKKFLCPVEHCQYIGRNGTALSMHKNTHTLKTEFKCEEEACRYQGKSAYHLKRHMKNHQELEKVYKCPECDFKAKIPGHIKRHVRIHTGECPYKCPHCDYSCGYIENLRKHILTTKKHPGKFIYECAQCDSAKQFKTNYNNEYQMHLTVAHPTYVSLKDL